MVYLQMVLWSQIDDIYMGEVAILQEMLQSRLLPHDEFVPVHASHKNSGDIKEKFSRIDALQLW